MEDMKKNKKICLIIGGAGQGYGRQILTTLLENNYQVVITSRYKSKLLGLTKSNKYNISQIDEFRVNLSSEKNINIFIKKIKDKYKKIDVLINNAAANCLKPFDKQTYRDWNNVLGINIISNIKITREILKIMDKKKIGRIINISSIYGIKPPKHFIYGNSKINSPLIYGVSKAGVIYLTKYFASIAPKNIRINCISPGGLDAKQPKYFKKNYEKFTTLKRMANNSDLKGIINYLINDSSNYVTGQNFIIDGGWSLN